MAPAGQSGTSTPAPPKLGRSNAPPKLLLVPPLLTLPPLLLAVPLVLLLVPAVEEDEPALPVVPALLVVPAAPVLSSLSELPPQDTITTPATANRLKAKRPVF